MRLWRGAVGDDRCHRSYIGPAGLDCDCKGMIHCDCKGMILGLAVIRNRIWTLISPKEMRLVCNLHLNALIHILGDYCGAFCSQ